VNGEEIPRGADILLDMQGAARRNGSHGFSFALPLITDDGQPVSVLVCAGRALKGDSPQEIAVKAGVGTERRALIGGLRPKVSVW
jgi:hypothetical protein